MQPRDKFCLAVGLAHIGIEAKLAGGQGFTAVEKPTALDDTDDVSDLLAKLEASVRRRREQSAAKTPAKKARARKAPAKN